MTEDEYREKLKSINDEHDMKLRKLNKNYAMQFKQADVGDIIVCSRNENVMRVERVAFTRPPRGEAPDIVYLGEQLKKRTLKPYKEPVDARMYGAYFGKILVKKGGDNE